MVVRVNPRSDGEPRVGFIVPGKIKGAVSRNRVRRFLTEAIRARLDKFPRRSEAVLIAAKEANGKNYEVISNWVDKAISKINTPSN